MPKLGDFDFVVEPVARESVNDLIEKHYLHKWPAIVAAVLGLREGDRYIGTIVFALPPRETNKRYCVVQSLELARLFVEDGTPKNTESWFISRAIRFIRQQFPSVELLVSYADPAHGHKGTVYRASNWIFDGRTDAGRKTPRVDLRVGHKSYSRWAHVPAGAEIVKVPRSSKYRFIYWMSDHEKRRSLKLVRYRWSKTL